jgi:serine/threonine protein phosphatase 1
VLELLSRSIKADSRVMALAGNHDLGFLAFLAQPRAQGLFANNGGDATARSYGVELSFTSREALLRGHAALMEAMPQEHLDCLQGLKLSASFGDFFFCHAGIRPGVPLDAQSAEDLIWIRERFRHDPTLHPKIVVHGHTPMPEPEIMPNRVNLDTGAWYSGRLTAMMFEGSRKRLLEVAG